MAKTIIVNGQIYEETGERTVIVKGRIYEETTVAAGGGASISRFTLPKLAHPDFIEPGRKPVGAVEIDWSNPLTRNLKAYYGNTNYPTDLVGSRPFVPLNTNWGTRGGPSGGGISNTATATALTVSGLPAIGTGDFTLFAHFTYDIHVSYSYFCSVSNTTGDALGLAFQSFGGITPYMWVGGALNGTTVFQQGDTYTLVGRRIGGIAWLFVNGVEDVTASRNKSMPGTNFNLLTDDPNGSFSQNDGRVLYSSGYIHGRAWSDAEIRAYHEDPYQIIKPAVPLSYFIPAAAGGGARPQGPFGHPFKGAFGGPI